MTVPDAVDTLTSLSMAHPITSSGIGGSSLLEAFGAATVAASVTLEIVRHWHRDRFSSCVEPSKRRLLEHAVLGLEPLASGALVGRAQGEQVMQILQDLIADAQPTPQIAVGEAGEVETIWLVNGTEVVLSIERNGSGVLAAYSPEDDLFEYEFDQLTDPLDRERIAEARFLLNQLGESVSHRILV